LGCRGACFDPTEHWILTDLADCDLRTLLSEEGDHLAGELRLRIACQMAEGLAELHRLELIHRDLKSANVLIVRRGSLELDIKIADFGLCRVTNKHMTQTTGTPLWRAPEVTGRNDYTKKADVYSYGELLLFGFYFFFFLPLDF
jgi:serine/threonine protein kinase